MKTAIKIRLTETDVDELVQIEERLASLSVEAREAADSCGLSRREIAMRMGNASPSTLQRLLKGMAYNATLDTIARFAWACGYELEMRLEPKVKAAVPTGAKAAGAEPSNLLWLDNYRRVDRVPAGVWSGIGPPAANDEFPNSNNTFAQPGAVGVHG